MTQQPINASALRGAVDLSGLGQRPARPDSSPGGGGGGAPKGMVVTISDQQQFSDLVSASLRHVVVVALFAASQPESGGPVDDLAAAVRSQGGKVQLGIVDIDQVPEIGQAFQQLGQQLAQSGQAPAGTPVTAVAFVQGQPMPLPPLPDVQAAQQLVEELVKVAVANGVTGRVSEGPEEGGTEDAEAPQSPHHDAAFEAIENGDFDAAIAAYEQAMAENPEDEDARLGLGQVKLLQRTSDLDATTVRADAAADPSNVQLACQVADLDVLGGHVEDAFTRLVDLVKTTAGDERNAAREHLIGLFDIIGSSDPRVKKARTALMSALF